MYIGDNSYIENCVIESRGAVKPGSIHIGEKDNIKVVLENDRYIV